MSIGRKRLEWYRENKLKCLGYGASEDMMVELQN